MKSFDNKYMYMYSINCSVAYKFLCVLGDTYQSKIGIEEDFDLEDIDPTPVSLQRMEVKSFLT